MKKILAFFIFFHFCNQSFGQAITYDDFKKIIPFLQKEDFKTAYEKTKLLLSSTENDSSDLRGIVTYMNIFSAAGMVTLDQMTHDNFLKNATLFTGQKLVMSVYPCIDSTAHGFNSLKFINSNGLIQGTVASTNSSKSNIFCFEYFNYAEPVDPSEFIGKYVRCGGILDSVEINSNKSKIWISRLHISNAFVRVTSPR